MGVRVAPDGPVYCGEQCAGAASVAIMEAQCACQSADATVAPPSAQSQMTVLGFPAAILYLTSFMGDNVRFARPWGEGSCGGARWGKGGKQKKHGLRCSLFRGC